MDKPLRLPFVQTNFCTMKIALFLFLFGEFNTLNFWNCQVEGFCLSDPKNNLQFLRIQFQQNHPHLKRFLVFLLFSLSQLLSSRADIFLPNLFCP